MSPICGCPCISYNRLYCYRQGPGGGNYCVTVRDENLVLTLPNSNDPNQFWYKDESSNCGFMLVNKATNKAVIYRNVGDQLQLVDKPICTCKSLLWNESEHASSGYKFIRTQCNLDLYMDAWTGHISHGTIVSIRHNVNNEAEAKGTIPNDNGQNQLWKLAP